MPITIGKYMMKNPLTIAHDETIGDASRLMRENQIRHLPVLNADEEMVGIISERDLRAALALDKGKSLLVSDIMKTDLLVARKSSSLADLIDEMADQKLGSALVVNEDDQIIGIFTTTDALYLLSTLLRNKEIHQARLDDAFFEAWPELKVRSHDFVAPL